jgi:hypothetical protein
MPEDSLKFKRPVISKQINQAKKEHAKKNSELEYIYE